MKKIAPAFLGCTVFLAACSAQQCDPNQADLFTGVGCSVGDGYQDRTDLLKKKYAEAKLNEGQQQKQALTAQQQAITAQKAVAQRRAELMQVDNKAWQLRKRVTQAQNSKKTLSRELKAEKAKLDQFDKVRAHTSSTNPSEKELNALTSILGGL
ncbi:hypothetical protein [Entomobacter blattae]|nr:hypothetical protein [Entomobacter blattae]